MGNRLGQRLYLRIWLAVVLAVAVLTLAAGALWQWAMAHERHQNGDRPERRLLVQDADGRTVGEARLLRLPRQQDTGSGFELHLPDGQVLTLKRPHSGPLRERPPPPAFPYAPYGFIGLLLLVALAVALGAYPIVRRLTQRLEALRNGVERWGQGDLSTRLPEQGQDEVAFLAQRFNAAAERVSVLLRSHKALLANASHELRSPLTRLRMGLALLGDAPEHAVRRAEMARSIEELDQLIDEILLASRLDLSDAHDSAALGEREELDLLGLAAEECARLDAELVLQGEGPWLLQGHPRLLRRLLRNLLENARRHGGAGAATRAAGGVRAGQDAAPPSGPILGLQNQDQGIGLVVDDHGPGVPPGLRERIFDPFYRLPGASETEGGVGLGLALVKTIAERHGGHVRCTERPGGGARFVVWLPR